MQSRRADRTIPFTTMLLLCILLPLSYQLSSEGTGTRCPGTCKCQKNNNGVLVTSCHSGFWRHVPPLPNDTGIFNYLHSDVGTLKNGSFSSTYTLMDQITLEDLNLTHIESDTFLGLPSLTHLNLNQNKLKSLTWDVFKHIPLLRVLSMGMNDIREIAIVCLCAASNIVTVSVKGNKIQRLNFQPCFQNLSEFQHLDLSNNPLGEIDSDDFKYLPPHIWDMRLSNCHLKSLSDDIFRYVQNLSLIQLSNNNLNSISDAIFFGMKKVSEVVLSGNKLQIFEPTWILKSVTSLNIQNNGITYLNASTTAQLQGIKTLIFDQNHIDNLTSDIFTSLGLNNIVYLSLQSCNLLRIHPYAFSNLTHLQILKLSENPLTAAVISEIFLSVRQSPLQELWMDNINLKGLDNQTFANFLNNNLTKLYIRMASIPTIERGVFKNLRWLKLLSMEGNQIISIGRGALEPLVNLEKLDLKKNHLVTCLDPLYLGLTPNLTTLDIDSNSVNHLTPGCVTGLPQIQGFNMDSNAIAKIYSHTFTGTNIVSISLYNNKITVIANNTFNNMPQLKSLNFKRNLIQSIHTECFQGLYALNTLIMTENPKLGDQTSAFVYAFHDLFSLENLQMEGCGIKEIPDGIFDALPNLTQLTLSKNEIVTWKPESFINQKNLQVLYFTNNRIVTLSSDSFTHLVALQEIYLDDNPFSCTCDLRWFQGWITGGSIFANLDYHNKQGYACASPPAVKGTSILDLDLSFPVCGPVDAVIGGSVGGLMFIIILVAAALIYRYRWYIRYGYFLFLRRLRQRRNQDNLIPYMFDAFVSYNHRDQRWVIERLLPALEYRGGLKLCLHDRNWLAGQAIAENILESIENSNKTVLIISNAFAQSEWCQLELHMAQHKLLTSRRDVLVLVVLEEPEPEHMTRTLRQLMTTQTYMAWDPDDQGKQRLFWQGLIRAIKNQNVEI